MKTCQQQFGLELGRRIEQTVEAALGRCPCSDGKPCILLDEKGAPGLLPRRKPRVELPEAV